MTSPATCTVYFDGTCPLCRREIAHYQRRASGADIQWIDASACDDGALGNGLTRAAALSRLHVRAADGSLVSGAAAFAAIWARVPGYGWAASVASRRPVLRLLEMAYSGFLRLRPLWRRVEPLPVAAETKAARHEPGVQARATAEALDAAPRVVTVNATAFGPASPAAPATSFATPLETRPSPPATFFARRLSSRPSQSAAAFARPLATTPCLPTAVIARPSTTRPRLPAAVIADLRTDHAGEVGAVQIYRGVLAVSADGDLRAFAARHLATELLHLQRIRRWLPAGERSRLLPLWRVAGWLIGAVPALLGPRAVFATVAAVERFVDRHYERQIAQLAAHPQLAELRAMLAACRRDEAAHRGDALARLRAQPGLLSKAWSALVGKGSALAVAASRRW